MPKRPGRSAVLAFLIAALSCRQHPPLPPGLAIVDVTIVDVASGTLRPNMTVLVSGGRITSIGAAHDVRLPERARRVRGDGKFLIPGLWDMQVRTGGNPTILYLMLGTGITSVRDVGDETTASIETRRQIDAHVIAGPRVFASKDTRASGSLLLARSEWSESLQEERGTPAGWALHAHLASLVAAGATPIDALRAATINPATVLGVSDSLGTIDVGKEADLVLVDANPLVDIRNTRRVSAVISRGNLVSER